MQWKALVLALLVERGSGQAMPMMRFQCSQLVVDRLDPLVNPGVVPSPHLHQIVGGNSFNASMDPKTHDLPSSSTCTSCTFSEDFSNYWGQYTTPSPVTEIMLTSLSDGLQAGLPDVGGRRHVPRAEQRAQGVPPLHAGDRRQEQHQLRAPDSQSLPNEMCPGGIRSVITFPTCWDGKTTDSVDHMSHVAYPTSSYNDVSVGAYGTCPASHPVKIPQVMYEVMWDTRIFNDRALWPEDGSQPFVWSTDDKSGYSQHGDYVFGWKGDSLQRAMDARCNGAVCGQLQTQSAESAMKCTKSKTVSEEIDGWLTEIPGMNMA
ncbi:hypothetical protein CIB48_g1986 [Xylaria polymorpha]|nr:hypothetical protein CIB48_g1986 [Xylaria polymorpha]